MVKRICLVALLIAVLSAATASAQAPRMLTASAIDPDSVNEWSARVSQMLRDGRLDIVRVDDDTMLPRATSRTARAAV